MPVKNCKIDGKSGYKWGNQGKCYPYTPNNETSRNNAKKKAIAQGIAIGDFVSERISFDYDGVLTTKKGRDLALEKIKEGYLVYVISARDHKGTMMPLLHSLGIPERRVFATGSNDNKIEKVKELGIRQHYDNNPNVINDLKLDGIKAKLLK